MALPLLAAGAGLAGLGAGIEELVRRGKGGPGGNFLTGYPSETKTFDRFTPGQQQLQNQSIQQALSLLQGGKSSLFAPLAQQARTQFQTQTLPSLAERFTSMGDSQRSSAFQGALGQAGAGLEQGLAGLESGHNLQLLQLLLGLGMHPSFETTYTPNQPGLLHGLAPSIGSYIGGPGIASLLASLGSQSQQQPNMMNRLGGM